MARRRDLDPDDYDDFARPARRGRFRCPYCGAEEIPAVKSKVSAAGWAVFVVLLLCVCGIPLCWLGLLIREQYRECFSCGIKVGG